MKKNLMLCALLLAVLLSGCAAEPPARANSRKHTESSNATGRERLLPLSRYPQNQTLPPKPRQKPSIPQIPCRMRTSTKAALVISSEPVSAPTESNAPTPEEAKQPPVLPEKPEKAESPKEETVRS